MEENLKVCVDLLDQSAFIHLPLGMHHLLQYVVPVRSLILFFFMVAHNHFFFLTKWSLVFLRMCDHAV